MIYYKVIKNNIKPLFLKENMILGQKNIKKKNFYINIIKKLKIFLD